MSILTLFTPGSYEFSIGEPKIFERVGSDGDPISGVRYVIKLAKDHNGFKKGAAQVYTCALNSLGNAAFSKRFIMAALGYKLTEADQERFDEKYAESDWEVKPEIGYIGSMWHEPVGRHVIADCEIKRCHGITIQSFDFKPVVH